MFYFHLTEILFLLMPTVVKIQLLNIFSDNIQRRPQDGDITPLPFLFIIYAFFHISLSLCISYFLISVVFSATVPIPNIYTDSSATLL